ncbi:protein-methionine-sulfoxide reductase heme-binding subunit MsrQ [Hydrogenophaga sp. 5NK40-0174]|uniref:sulfite oxidase heme-binding subunit YedZ n=1 Tax=Hydrogenophaga sp. 5NK40-0174 TaxID=3127649 RepID=UPI0031086F40
MAYLCWAAVADQLGANPAEALIRSLGDWTMRALVAVMCVTPLRELLGWPSLARIRRMLGLFVFFYATLHLTAYAWFDMGFLWIDVLADIAKRPFILVGVLSWLALLAMAATSFNRAIRWLGAQRWKSVHRSVHAVVVLSILHFFWMRAGKNLFGEVAVYASIFLALESWRLWQWRRRRQLTAS